MKLTSSLRIATASLVLVVAAAVVAGTSDSASRGKSRSAVKFQGSLLVQLAVSDLDRSIAFYRAFFGIEPSKVRADYAKFEPADPPVNGRTTRGGRLRRRA